GGKGRVRGERGGRGAAGTHRKTRRSPPRRSPPEPTRPLAGRPCLPDTEWRAVAEIRPPLGCISFGRGGRGSCPCVCDRAGLSVSLRGLLRRPATSRRRCPARNPPQERNSSPSRD